MISWEKEYFVWDLKRVIKALESKNVDDEVIQKFRDKLDIINKS